MHYILASAVCEKAIYEMLSVYLPNQIALIKSGNYCLGFDSSLKECHFSNHECTAFLCGVIKNEQELQKLLSTDEKGPRLIYTLYKTLGREGFSLIEGMFNFIIMKTNGELEAFRDTLGLMPLYYTRQLGSLWLVNQAKLFIPNQAIDLSLKPRASVNYALDQPDDFSIFNQIHKVPPGGFIRENGKVERFADMNRDLAPVSRDEAIASIRTLLKRTVRLSINGEKEFAVLLSGGVDSSTVTALCKEQAGHFHTISMGTESSNEFAFASIVAKHVDSTHHELTLSDELVIEGIVSAIYENEIFDGLSAEIHAPLHHLYAYASRFAKKLITGYGADLLFGGTLSPTTAPSEVNPSLWQLIYRTRWTGEFSPFLAHKFNIQIEHPFWNVQLMRFALSLPPQHKVDGKEVKVALREFASKDRILPEEIVWRKKIGIHQASSINTIFSRFTGTDKIEDYSKKDDFAYHLFRLLFQERIPLQNINVKNRLIIESLHGDVMLIQLNHPNRHNPFDRELKKALIESLNAAEQNPLVKAICVTGGEGRSFSVGGNFNEVKYFKGGSEVNEWIDRIMELYTAVLRLTKPTVAALDGYAIGIGFQLAMLFDWRIGTSQTKLAMSELKNGIGCTVGSCILGKVAGRNTMKQLVYGCEDLTAEQSLELGFLNEVSDQLLESALQRARKLAAYPTAAFSNTKKSINQGYLEEMYAVTEVTKEAHRAAFKAGDLQNHFKKVLKEKYADQCSNV